MDFNDEIIELAKEISNLETVEVSDIPEIDLYMDQVTTFMETKLASYKRNNNDKNNQQQNQESKIPKDLQKLILERSANQEKETARKLLNKNAYSIPESNEKDW